MTKFRMISLFSGAGGLDLGFIRSGFFEIKFANDISVPALRTYSTNFGLRLSICDADRVEAQTSIALACDIDRVDLSPLKDNGIDVVIGGPPCQDFSIVRGPGRKGIEVKRGKLYSYFVKALAILQPKAFLFENVFGLTSANNGLAYRYILEDFSSLNLRWEEVKTDLGNDEDIRPTEGYHIIHSKVLDLSHFGVPQRRRRLIIVGIRKDLIRTPERLREIQNVFFKSLRESMGLFPKYPLSTLEVFGGKRLDELDITYKEIMKKWEGIWLEVETERALEWKEKVWDKLTFDIINDYLLVNKIRGIRKEELEEALNQHEVILKEMGYYGVPVYNVKPIDRTNEIPEHDQAIIERMRRIPFNESHTFVLGTGYEIYKKAFSYKYRRLHPLKPAYTILAYGGGGSYGYHYERERIGLTLREKARLQSFPDSFIFLGSKSDITGQIGEAVPPVAAERLAKALGNVLSYF